MATPIKMPLLGVALAALVAGASCSQDSVPQPSREDEDDAVASDGPAEPAANRDGSTDSRPRDASVPGMSDARAPAPVARDAASVVGAGTPNDGGDATVLDASPPSEPDAASGQGETCTASAAPPRSLTLSGNLGTHDPVAIASGGQYHQFQTGRGIPTKTSSDLMSWSGGAPVFATNPAWVTRQVPGATDLWAPDISQFGGAFHLYYSVSTFGSNRSCIGHATRASLESGSWSDQGSVLCSNANGNGDDWNAIDPNIVLDEEQTPWLSFGSFWSGLKMVKLDAQGKRADDKLIAIAGRNGGPIEAPFIVRRCDYYYLFVSFDRCCAGADSTYKIMVGRSREVTGPYVDKSGKAMTQGGGSPVLSGAGSWVGPGHNAILRTAKGDYNIYHAYSSRDGHSELRISELTWDAEGWPLSAGP